MKWPTLLESFDQNNFTITFNSSISCSAISALEFIGYETKLKYKEKLASKLDLKTDSGSDDNQSLKSQVQYFCKDESPFNVFIDVKQLNPIYSLSKYAWVFKFYLII